MAEARINPCFYSHILGFLHQNHKTQCIGQKSRVFSSHVGCSGLVVEGIGLWGSQLFIVVSRVIVQWGTNQNVVFEIAVRKISRLPTLKVSRELKNWYFPTKF